MKKQSRLFSVLSVILCLAFVLTACSTAATETAAPAATTAPAGEEAVATEAPAAEGETITVIFPKHEADIIGAYEARIHEFEKKPQSPSASFRATGIRLPTRRGPRSATGGFSL
jgi:ABC-type glycerol-3-phosphate transport system substrate-binding protein